MNHYEITNKPNVRVEHLHWLRPLQINRTYLTVLLEYGYCLNKTVPSSVSFKLMGTKINCTHANKMIFISKTHRLSITTVQVNNTKLLKNKSVQFILVQLFGPHKFRLRHIHIDTIMFGMTSK